MQVWALERGGCVRVWENVPECGREKQGGLLAQTSEVKAFALLTPCFWKWSVRPLGFGVRVPVGEEGGCQEQRGGRQRIPSLCVHHPREEPGRCTSPAVTRGCRVAVGRKDGRAGSLPGQGSCRPPCACKTVCEGHGPRHRVGRGRELSHLDSKLPQITGEAPEAIARAVGHTQERPVTERETGRWRET